MKMWNIVLGLMCALWCLGVLAIGAGPHVARVDWASDVAASWAQAIFSGLAVLAAIAVAAGQSISNQALLRQQRRLAWQERIAPISALVSLAVEAAEDARDDRGWLEWGWQPSLFSEIEAELAQVPVLSLGDFTIPVIFMRFRKAFANLNRTLGVYRDDYAAEARGDGPGPGFYDDEQADWIDVRRTETLSTGEELLQLLRIFGERGSEGINGRGSI